MADKVHAIIRDPFGTVIAEGDLPLSPDAPIAGEDLTWHQQLRDMIGGRRMQLLDSSVNQHILYDLEVIFDG